MYVCKLGSKVLKCVSAEKYRKKRNITNKTKE